MHYDILGFQVGLECLVVFAGIERQSFAPYSGFGSVRSGGGT